MCANVRVLYKASTITASHWRPFSRFSVMKSNNSHQNWKAAVSTNADQLKVWGRTKSAWQQNTIQFTENYSEGITPNLGTWKADKLCKIYQKQKFCWWYGGKFIRQRSPRRHGQQSDFLCGPVIEAGQWRREGAEKKNRAKVASLQDPHLNHCHQLHGLLHSDLITCGPRRSISHRREKNDTKLQTWVRQRHTTDREFVWPVSRRLRVE